MFFSSSSITDKLQGSSSCEGVEQRLSAGIAGAPQEALSAAEAS